MSEEALRAEIASLERSLLRERNARKNAEDILRKKVMEAFEANSRLETATERLRLALWAGRESVWEWDAKDDIFRLFTAANSKDVQINRKGTFQDAVDSIHDDYQAEFLSAWKAHETLETKSFDVTLPRLSERTGKYRWARMRGRITERDEDGNALHFLGLFKDAESSVIRNQTYQTIVDAFLNSSRPGFIINFKSMHIECNQLGYDTLETSKDVVTDDILKNKLPITRLMEAIENSETKFAASIKNDKNEDIPIGIYLSEIPDMKSDNPHCVGFFSTKAFPK